MNDAKLRIGMVGLDTSHCEAFTKLLNDEGNIYHVAGGEVVKAFPGGSKLFSNSYTRVEKITSAMRELGIEIVDSIAALGDEVDAFMLESVDGRQHLEQFQQLVKFGKPVFIDKPLSCSYDDARAIVDLAAEYGIPVMSASAIRYAAGITELNPDGEPVNTCDAFGPMALPEDYPGYFWYGIHSVEMLYSFMGRGCEALKVEHSDRLDVVIARWQDGRRATLRGLRFESGSAFGCTVSTAREIAFSLAKNEPPYYARLLKQIIPFFRSGKSPVALRESLEVIAFLEAMDKSRLEGGSWIEIAR